MLTAVSVSWFTILIRPEILQQPVFSLSLLMTYSRWTYLVGGFRGSSLNKMLMCNFTSLWTIIITICVPEKLQKLEQTINR